MMCQLAVKRAEVVGGNIFDLLQLLSFWNVCKNKRKMLNSVDHFNCICVH